jgi:type I restriction enzyme S subunit
MGQALVASSRSAAPRVGPATATAAGAFDLEKFVESFPVLAEAEGGVEALRQLALQMAFQGRFTGNQRPLVPASVRGHHRAIGPSNGREATTSTMSGGAALAVGAAEMLIPEGWEWLPLVSVARLESGHTPSRNHLDYWDGGVPWIGIRDARKHNYGWIDVTEQTVSKKGLENSSARLLPAGTVCLSRTASVGYVTIMKRSMATSQDFVNWVCGDRLLPEYLMQLLRCEVPVLRRFSKGAVHQTIYFPEVKAFHISLPPLAEQKRIVAKVDELMRLIDDLEAKQAKKRETQARLRTAALDALTSASGAEEFAAAWERVAGNFGVLFERVDALEQLRAALLWLAVTGGLSGLGRSAWPTDVLGNVAESRLGKMLDKVKNKGTPRPYLRNTNVHWFSLRLDDIKNMPFEDSEVEDYKLRVGDVLVCEGGHGIGRAAVWRGERETMMFQKALHRLRPSASMDSDFLSFQLKVAADCGRLSALFTGAGIPHLTGRSFARLEVVVPPLAEQKRIVTKVEALMKLCDDLEAKLKAKETTAAGLVEAVVAEMVA